MKAQWGSAPEFFGPRHAHREGRILRRIKKLAPDAGLHIECAAGVGSLTLTLAHRGLTVVAADMSLRSLDHLAQRAKTEGIADRVLPVIADMGSLPFADETFSGASSAETFEHIADDSRAASDLARVLAPDSWLVGTVPAGPSQFSDWDTWAGHIRRYTRREMQTLLGQAGLEAEVTVWGWPVLRLYDDLFMTRVNRRRLQFDGKPEQDPALRRVSNLGKRRYLVAAVRIAFEMDRLFDGLPWGVGLIFAARKPAPMSRT